MHEDYNRAWSVEFPILVYDSDTYHTLSEDNSRITIKQFAMKNEGGQVFEDFIVSRFKIQDCPK